MLWKISSSYLFLDNIFKKGLQKIQKRDIIALVMKHKSIFYFLSCCTIMAFLTSTAFGETVNECITNCDETHFINSSCTMSGPIFSVINTLLLLVLGIFMTLILIYFVAITQRIDNSVEEIKERSSKHNDKVCEIVDNLLSEKSEYKLINAQRWNRAIPKLVPRVLYIDDRIGRMFGINSEGVVLKYKNAAEEKIEVCSYKNTNVTIHGDAIEHVWFTKSSDFVARMNDICDDFIQKREEEELNRIN